jgi:hypothetical protein
VELYQPTDEQKTAWDEWVAGRPKNVATVAGHFNPWTLYEFKETGQKVTLISFEEQKNGSVSLSVSVSAEHNPTCLFERSVFNVPPYLLRVAREADVSSED